MPDKQLEMNYTKIAEDILNRKLPSLTPYRIGTQLVESSEDTGKAVGLSAYVIGDSWLYIPVIFDEGKTEGDNLLYVKQADLFFPSTDAIISIMLSKSVDYMVPDDENDSENATEPGNIEVPGSDSGDGLSDDVDPTDYETSDDRVAEDCYIEPGVLKRMMKETGAVDRKASSFLKIAERYPKQAADWIYTMSKDPEFANATFRYVTPDEIGGLWTKVKGFTKKAESDVTELAPNMETLKEVEVFTGMSPDAADKLSDKEKEFLVKDGFYIKDSRKETAKVFRPTMKSDVLTSIRKPGLYEVLMRDATFEPFLILTCESNGDTYAISPDEPTVARTVHQKNTLVSGRYDSPWNKAKSDILRKEYKKLESSLYGRPVSDASVLAGKTGGKDATRANLVKMLNEDMREQYPDGQEANSWHTIRVLFTQTTGRVFLYSLSMRDGKVEDEDIDFTGKNGKLSRFGGTLFVPKGARMFLVKDSIEAGDMRTMEHYLLHETGLERLQLRSPDGKYTSILFRGTEGAGEAPMTMKTAAEFLVSNCGIYAGQARQLLQEAAREREVDYYIRRTEEQKQAADVQAAPDNEQVTKMDPQGVKEMGSKAKEAVVAASEAGIQEVFDVTAWKAMLSESAFGEMQKEEISEYIRNMDRLGRRLMFLYANREAMEDKYGKESLPELKQTLEDTFRNMGDIVLFLREKSNVPVDDVDNTLGELSEEYGGAYGETE